MSATRVAERPGAGDGPAPLSFPERPALVFEVGGSAFGIALGQVREVTQPGPVTRLPHVAAFVAGITVVRGRLVPVIDGGAFLLDRAGEPGGRLVVLDAPHGEMVALRVRRVLGVLDLDTAVTRPAPAEAISALPEGFIDRVALQERGPLVTVLDIGRVLEDALGRLRPEGRGGSQSQPD